MLSDRPRSDAPRNTGSGAEKPLEKTPPSVPTPATEVELLRSENAALQETVAELQQLLEERLQAEQAWVEQQKDQEALLEEKSQVIRELHLKLQESLAAAATSAAATPAVATPAVATPADDTSAAPREAAAAPHEDELLALSEELEHERRQLKEDEEALMAQMREMEVQMSRERAELARQRNDLQRLHSEVHHELELASRHATLRDRLLPLQRRHQEMLHRKGSDKAREGAAPGETPTSAAPVPSPEAPARDGSGLLRRLFG